MVWIYAACITVQGGREVPCRKLRASIAALVGKRTTIPSSNTKSARRDYKRRVREEISLRNVCGSR